MHTKLAVFAIFSLFAIMITPAYADVTSLSLGKSFYTDEENFKFIGVQDGSEIIFVIVRDAYGNFKGMLSDPTPSQGEFEVTPKSVSDFFSNSGIYNATAFAGSDKEEDGLTIELEYDGTKIFEVPDLILKLDDISDKTINVEKTITFTASITDRSIDDVIFSLNNEPTGATIDPDSGKFIWTPSRSQGGMQDVHYDFDVIASQGNQEDKEKIKITVKQAHVEPVPKLVKSTPAEPAPEPATEPKSNELGLAPFVDESKDPQSYVDRYNNETGYKAWFDESYPEYDSIYQAVGLKEPLAIPAPFVDESKDPQSYVDRYNNETGYKAWFDESYPEYDSIYQAVGLKEPKKLAPFVNPDLDPRQYIDRYNNEVTYKNWFDGIYPDITIYEAVGLEETEVEESKIKKYEVKESEVEESKLGECGEGTKLVDGTCVIVDNSEVEGGGCLIATATYGTELAPQVQLLREIRDNTIMDTSFGMSFMTGFNQLYYSFSPTIADMQRENPVFKETVRVFITPMISTLSIMTLADADSEIQVLGLGISVVLLNLGMYIAAPTIVVFKARKHFKI